MTQRITMQMSPKKSLCNIWLSPEELTCFPRLGSCNEKSTTSKPIEMTIMNSSLGHESLIPCTPFLVGSCCVSVARHREDFIM
mmetsp:Transcript_53581/g.96254  ORF Transcript_53581/g.96254 Transcript_53581/m.96254 type:complete len:83 (+) Transcript_53581:1587-1835(+)